MWKLTQLLLGVVVVAVPGIIEINKDASFKVHGTEGFFLESGSYMVRKDGKTYTTADGSLGVKQTAVSSGLDNMGEFHKYSFSMTPEKSDEPVMEARIKVYGRQNVAIFTQDFPKGVKGMSLKSKTKVTSSFPSVKVPSKSDSFYLNPCDDMGGWEQLKKGPWQQSGMNNMCKGDPRKSSIGNVETGPFFIFDATNMTENYPGQIVSISAASKFPVHFIEVNHEMNEIRFGLPGTTDEIPDEGFEIQTIISYGDNGFYNGVQKWGAELQRKYGKTDKYRATDDSVNYLSYWTDNGAFYYYNTIPNTTYEDTMLSVYSDVRRGDTNAPFRSWNFDSWWYPKCDNGAVKSWTSMDSVFPSGMSSVYEKTSLPVVAHNRWWCNETDYAKRQGGAYDFVFNDATGTAVPTDLRFWDDLFANSTTWGLSVYLQDWLNKETVHLSVFETDLNLERDWLLKMGMGAEAHGVNILYCMAYPRHMLQSVEIPNVVSLRASGDYRHQRTNQWDIGLSSAWVHAIGLAPFKDTFWTTETQSGNSYDGDTEPRPKLQAVMATLSTGIVGIGDKIGSTNMDLVKRSIMPDGKILKPSRPLVVPDYLVWQVDPNWNFTINGTSEFETWSDITGQKFGIIVAYNPGNKSLHLENYQFGKDSSGDVIARVERHHGSEVSTEHKKWSAKKHLSTVAGEQILLMVYQSPIWKFTSSEVSFLGEVDKWAFVSPQRFTDISINDGAVRISFKGVPAERVNMRISVQANGGKLQLIDHSCTLPSSGKAVLHIHAHNPEKPKVYCVNA